MSYQSSSPTTVDRHLLLWVYLLPVVGLVPAVWTLYRAESKTNLSQSDCQASLRHRVRQSRQKKASRLAVNLNSIWLSSYILCFWGADRASEILSFRLLYLNTIITSGYFLTCIYLMFRLSKKSTVSPDRSD